MTEYTTSYTLTDEPYSLEDLAATKDYKFIVVRKSSAYSSILRLSDYEPYKQIYLRLVNNPNSFVDNWLKGVEIVKTNSRIALIDTNKKLLSMSMNKPCNYRVIVSKQLTSSFPEAFPFRRGHSILNNFNKALFEIKQSDQYKNLSRKWYPNRCAEKSKGYILNFRTSLEDLVLLHRIYAFLFSTFLFMALWSFGTSRKFRPKFENSVGVTEQIEYLKDSIKSKFHIAPAPSFRLSNDTDDTTLLQADSEILSSGHSFLRSTDEVTSSMNSDTLTVIDGKRKIAVFKCGY